MTKNQFYKKDLLFNYFDKGSQDAILKISMEIQKSLILI